MGHFQIVFREELAEPLPPKTRDEAMAFQPAPQRRTSTRKAMNGSSDGRFSG